MDPLALLKAIILGLVEGLTEFLPVSSTAHLILLSQALGFERSETFKVVIQFGAILALVTVYFDKIWTTTTSLPSRAESRRFALSVILAFLPAIPAGILLEETLSRVFLADVISPTAGTIIASTLIAGGIIMLLVERFRPVPVHSDPEQLPLWKSFAVGCCQALALIPGVSRSGATIVGALTLGVDRRAAAEFSFFLSIPTMAAATVYKVYKDWDQLDFSNGALIGVGFVAAFIAAFIVVKPFLALVSRFGFAPFAFYRIALGLVVIGAIQIGLWG
ncbi:MAG: undecaprenyl-diphosphate phosphatase [Alphaproteobacteria bacterium]|jgi:undecaprenyl-diphosphatase|nr:undecaprenyl-diphosphate phosphatase [Alphaproteobacteria bacterium]